MKKSRFKDSQFIWMNSIIKRYLYSTTIIKYHLLLFTVLSFIILIVRQMWLKKELKTLQIQSRISSVNQSIRDKAQQQNTIYRQFNSSKKSISQLEETVDASIQTFQDQTKELRQKLKRVLIDMKKMDSSSSQRRKRFKSRLDQIKLRTDIQLIKQSHTSQQDLAKIQQQFEKIQSQLKNNEDLKNPLLTNKLKSANKYLSQQIPLIKSEIDEQRRKSDTFLQQIMNQLQTRIEEFKKKMIELEHSNDETFKLLNEQILQTKNEIEDQLQMQRQAREQNKEKLLLLFETKAEKSLLLKK